MCSYLPDSGLVWVSMKYTSLIGISCCITISKLSRARLGRTEAFNVKNCSNFSLNFPQSFFQLQFSKSQLKAKTIWGASMVADRDIKLVLFNFCVKLGWAPIISHFLLAEQLRKSHFVWRGSPNWHQTISCCSSVAKNWVWKIGVGYFLKHITAAGWKPCIFSHHFLFRNWEKQLL